MKIAGLYGTCTCILIFEFMHVLIHKQDLQLMVSGIACAPSETPDLCQYLKFTLWQDESTVIYLPSK